MTRSGSSTGSPRMSTALTKVNTVAFTPIPSARASVATSVNHLSLISRRMANWRSCERPIRRSVFCEPSSVRCACVAPGAFVRSSVLRAACLARAASFVPRPSCGVRRAGARESACRSPAARVSVLRHLLRRSGQKVSTDIESRGDGLRLGTAHRLDGSRHDPQSRGPDGLRATVTGTAHEHGHERGTTRHRTQTRTKHPHRTEHGARRTKHRTRNQETRNEERGVSASPRHPAVDHQWSVPSPNRRGRT